MTAVFTGLRASELRGLRWQDVDFRRGEITVRQRADRYNRIGAPKSKAGKRTIPVGPVVINALKEWKLACPKGDLDLVFPTSAGRIAHQRAVSSKFERVLIKAHVITRPGKPKYGLHAMRHFYASWSINRKVDGGLELPLKVVQTRLGHSSIQMTADRYGHLFPHQDDGAELAMAEKALLGIHTTR